MKLLSRFWLFVTPWTIACQAPPSMEFSRQGYWNELPFPSPGDLPHPGIEPGSPTLQADSLQSEPPGKHHALTHLIYLWNVYWTSIECQVLRAPENTALNERQPWAQPCGSYSLIEATDKRKGSSSGQPVLLSEQENRISQVALKQIQKQEFVPLTLNLGFLQNHNYL